MSLNWNFIDIDLKYGVLLFIFGLFVVMIFFVFIVVLFGIVGVIFMIEIVLNWGKKVL